MKHIKANNVATTYSKIAEFRKFVDAIYVLYDQMDGNTVPNIIKEKEHEIDEIEKNISNNKMAKTIFDDAVREFNLAKESLLKAHKLYNSIEIGEEQDEALAVLQNVLSDASYGYDSLTVDDMKRQINDFDGTVKIPGPVDLYVKFKDYKVASKYF